MGVRLTFGLVVLAAVTLILGFVSHTAWLIYFSIACSFLATVGLLMSTRKRRKRSRAQAEDDMSWTASLAEPPVAASRGGVRPLAASDTAPYSRPRVAASSSPPARERAPAGDGYEPEPDGPTRRVPARLGSTKRNAVASDLVQHPRQEHAVDGTALGRSARAGRVTPVSPVSPVIPVSPVTPVPARAGRLPSPASPASVPATAGAVRGAAPSGGVVARPIPPAPGAPSAGRAGRSVPSVAASAPVSQTATAARAAPASRVAPISRVAPVSRVTPAAPPTPAPPAAPAAAAVRRRPMAPPVSDYPFPIEDYDYLGPADILPLLPELDDEELVEILVHEQASANRVAILNRIDALLEGEDW